MTARKEIAPGDWARLKREMRERGVTMRFWPLFWPPSEPTISLVVASGSPYDLWHVGALVEEALSASGDEEAARRWEDSGVWAARGSWTPERLAYAIRVLRVFLGYSVAP